MVVCSFVLFVGLGFGSYANELVKPVLMGVERVVLIIGFALGVLSVSDSVPDNRSEEGLEDFSDLLVDCEGDSLDSTSTSQTSDRGLCDSLDQRSSVLLHVSLLSDLAGSFSDTFSTFSCTSHLLFTLQKAPLYRPLPYRPKIWNSIGRFSKKGFFSPTTGAVDFAPVPQSKGPGLPPPLAPILTFPKFEFIFYKFC